jgi:hypothetical protein
LRARWRIHENPPVLILPNEWSQGTSEAAVIELNGDGVEDGIAVKKQLADEWSFPFYLFVNFNLLDGGGREHGLVNRQ